MRGRRALAGVTIAATMAALACLNDTPVSPGNAGIQLELHTQIVGQVDEQPGASQTIEIAVFYHRSDGDSVLLVTDPPRLSVAAGTTTQHSLAVEIGPCLTDPQRVGANADGCQLSVVLQLLDAAGDTLDRQTITPPGAVKPGQTISTPAITLHTSPPTILISIPAVSFIVPSKGAVLTPDTLSVTADRGSVHGLQATVSYPGEAQQWLTATVSADSTPAQLVLTPATQDIAPGTYTATVTVQSGASGVVPDPQTVAVSLNVLQPSIASLTVSPQTATITIGNAPRTFIALPKDGQGQVLSGRAVQWTSSDPAIATVSASSSMSADTGATISVSAVDTGSAYIRATAEGRSDSALVTVQVAPVATVTLTPAADTILAGDSTVISAALMDVHGNVLTGRTINWATDSPSVASLGSGSASTITVTGVRQGGPVRIIATSEGRADTALVTVLNPVSNVVVSIDGEPVATVQVGAAVQAAATLADSIGNVLTGRSITWTSTNTAVATVDATTGDSVSVTTHFVGTTYIKANSEGVVDSVPVTVTPATLPVFLGNCPSPKQVADINDNDVVVGVCGGDPTFSFMWSAANNLEVNIGSPADSGFLAVQAVAINNSGEIALTITRSDESPHPAIRTPSGSIVLLPLLPGGRNGFAAKINEFGQVLGQSDTSSDPAAPGFLHTFVWTPATAGGTTGTMVDVDAFGDAFAADTSDVVPIDIDDAGNIIVRSGGAFYLIEPSTRGASTVTVALLAGLPSAVARNNNGQVASNVPNTGVPGDSLAALWENSTATPLALPPNGISSNALDINDLGQIVGTMEINTLNEPFIWTSATGMVSLGTGPIQQAQAVNNKGNAVGGTGDQPILWCTSAPSVCVPPP